MSWQEANKNSDKEIEICKQGYMKMVFLFSVEEEEKNEYKDRDLVFDFSKVNEEPILLSSKTSKTTNIERFVLFINPEKPREENIQRVEELVVFMFDSLMKIKSIHEEEFSRKLREYGLLKEKSEFVGAINPRNIMLNLCPQEVFNVFGSSSPLEIQRYSSNKNSIMEIIEWAELLGSRRYEAGAYYEVFDQITDEDGLKCALIGEKHDLIKMIKREELCHDWWDSVPDYIKENIDWDSVADDYLRENPEIESNNDEYFFWRH